MEIREILQLIMPFLTIIFGALSAYLRAHDKLTNSSIKYITQAEEMYKDISNAGGQKFEWVVDTLYNMIPSPLKVIVNRKFIAKIVQETFDGIEQYAKTQLDKAIDKYVLNKLEENQDNQ